MTFVRRGFALAALMILAFTAVPVSVAPSGGLEVDGLCASTDCERSAGNYCWDPESGDMVWGYKSVVGRD